MAKYQYDCAPPAISRLLQKRAAFSATLMLLTLFASQSAFAEALNADEWKRFGIEVVERHILPAHKTFAAQTQTLDSKAKSYCSQGSHDSLNQLQAQFRSTVAAWQTIQGIPFGPVEISMRHTAIQFWPDKKNHVGKRLAALLAEAKDNALTPERFATLPVSVKGLPAVERILFSSDSARGLADSPAYCAVLTAITTSLSEVGISLLSEWRESMLPQFLDPRQLDGYFEDEIDAATALLKTLVEPIEYNRDLKLLRPMGSKLEHAKYKRLEFWRSELALRSLDANLKSAENFYFLGADRHPTASRYSLSKLMRSAQLQPQAEAIESAFIVARRTLDAIPFPMEQSILTREGYALVKAHAVALGTLHLALESGVSGLGIHLGFNSRDGD